MKLTLPLPPNRANARWHWRTEKRKHDAWMNLATVVNRKRPRRPLQKAHVHATMYLHQTMDRDNLVARMKWPLDWLVERGFLEDDTPSVVVSLIVEQAIDRKNQRVEIEVEGLIDA